MYNISSTEQVLKYLNTAMEFPTKVTMLNAVCKNWLVGWSGLTVESITKFFPESDKTQKSHVKQQRQDVWSTKVQETKIEAANSAPEMLSYPPEPKMHLNNVHVKVWETKEEIFTDQTGKFPYQSVSGNRYLMVMVEIDSNYIDA